MSCDVLSIGAATGADEIRIVEGWGISSSRAAGGPNCDEINIRIDGHGKDGTAMNIEQSVTCPRGAVTFTVIAADILLERLAGLDGGPPLSPGLYTAEQWSVQPSSSSA